MDAAPRTGSFRSVRDRRDPGVPGPDPTGRPGLSRRHAIVQDAAETRTARPDLPRVSVEGARGHLRHFPGRLPAVLLLALSLLWISAPQHLLRQGGNRRTGVPPRK